MIDPDMEIYTCERCGRDYSINTRYGYRDRRICPECKNDIAIQKQEDKYQERKENEFITLHGARRERQGR